MKCVFCQNYDISSENLGREISEERLAEIFLELQGKGAQNINLVNPTHFVTQILRVDVSPPDVKYFSDDLARRLSAAPNYFDTAMRAVAEMIRQTGRPTFDGNGAIRKGVIVRHLVLPWQYRDSVEIIKRVGERFGGDILFSLMSQYTPFGRVKTDPELAKMNRRVTSFEYQKALEAVYDAGLKGFMQEKSSAKEEYTPQFDLEGL